MNRFIRKSLLFVLALIILLGNTLLTAVAVGEEVEVNGFPCCVDFEEEYLLYDNTVDNHAPSFYFNGWISGFTTVPNSALITVTGTCRWSGVISSYTAVRDKDTGLWTVQFVGYLPHVICLSK